jgi:AcrR family transcriptional regulator
MAYRKTEAVKAHLKAQREAIIQAGIDVLAKHGKDGFTTTRVVERAGISNASLYNYFADASELWVGVVKACLARDTEAIRNAASRGKDPVNALARAIEAIYAGMSRQPRLVKSLADAPVYRRAIRIELELLIKAIEPPSRESHCQAAAMLGALYGLADADAKPSKASALCLMILGVPEVAI